MGPTTERPCYVQPGSWHMDDQNPFMRMAMLNTGRWCGVTVSSDRRAAERRQAIIAQPTHGTARVRSTSAGAVAEYLPTPGYAGRDSYRFTIGPGHVRQRGGIWVQVEVAAAHAAAVEIWGGNTSTIAGVSSAMASVCM